MSRDLPNTELPESLADRVRDELRDGERLLWSGQPRPDLAARGGIFLTIFGVFFFGFALLWTSLAGGMAGIFAFVGNQQIGPASFFSLCFPAFGIPFLVIGFFLMTSPIWMRRRAARTVYAVTDRRAVIWEPAFWGGGFTVRSYTAEGLGQMSRTERPDGAGNLIFEEFTTTSYDSDHGTRTTRHQRGFLGIESVRAVEELIRRTLLRE